ncbi:hypothetical protein DdX_19012 [Ditylenchus destructor]|uniref:Saposin B-type domain-containing protein n=1 Tax=Ditylenchus destructor TaxID=166010 RepID=A0AAD4ML87_9BILA|nr:hypothetical protein DdX_19012 [Ditylenchus destructor]
MSVLGMNLSIAIVVIFVLSMCSAKYLGSNAMKTRLEKIYASSEFFALPVGVCETCTEVVDALDDQKTIPPPAQDYVANFIKFICPIQQDHPFCEALRGKENDFARAYLKHRENREFDACKALHLCK